MSEVERIDALIIGTGQAGKPLAGALAEARWKTAIIEEGPGWWDLCDPWVHANQDNGRQRACRLFRVPSG